MAKKVWPIRTELIHSLGMRFHPFLRFRESPSTGKSVQSPLQRKFPAQKGNVPNRKAYDAISLYSVQI